LHPATHTPTGMEIVVCSWFAETLAVLIETNM